MIAADFLGQAAQIGQGNAKGVLDIDGEMRHFSQRLRAAKFVQAP
jgi:hypothetical protein